MADESPCEPPVGSRWKLQVLHESIKICRSENLERSLGKYIVETRIILILITKIIKRDSVD